MLGKLSVSPGRKFNPAERIAGDLFLSTAYLYPITDSRSEFYWGQNLNAALSDWQSAEAGNWNFRNPLSGGVEVQGIDGIQRVALTNPSLVPGARRG
jgi:hypothetical protein